MAFIFLINILVYHIGLSGELTEDLVVAVLAMDISYLLYKGDIKYTYKFLGLLTGYAIIEHTLALEGFLYAITLSVLALLEAIVVSVK
jgi:hypothetical protein